VYFPLGILAVISPVIAYSLKDEDASWFRFFTLAAAVSAALVTYLKTQTHVQEAWAALEHMRKGEARFIADHNLTEMYLVKVYEEALDLFYSKPRHHPWLYRLHQQLLPAERITLIALVPAWAHVRFHSITPQAPQASEAISAGPVRLSGD
jgi:hypothetical protein